MTPICSHDDCFNDAEFDSIFMNEGQVCGMHAQLETLSDGYPGC